MKTRVLVTGGRKYRNREAVFSALDAIESQTGSDIIVIEGGQRGYEDGKPVCGADFFANKWAEERGRVCLTYFAPWEREGSAAGPIRNSEMLRISKPQFCLAFPGGPGTADMRRKAKSAGVTIIEGEKYE